MLSSILHIFILLYSVNICVGKRYYNYTLYRAIPVNQSHLDFFDTLNEFYDVNFWRPPGLLRKPVEFVVNPTDKKSFLRDANRNGIYLTTIISDVQKAFDKQTVKSYIRRNMDSFDWDNYFRLDDIYHWIQDLAKTYPDVVVVKSIGKSFESRNIISVRIALRDPKYLRSSIIIEGGIHAREWIGPAFVTYMIHEVLNANKSNDKVWRDIANNYLWYFIPVLNVDGYEYTHTVDRLWRKNRHGNGVDLNRNFGHAFGTTGVSWSPTSDLYCGTHAFSEPETKAMSEFIKGNKKNLEFYLAFHSYGQYMILPYANLKTHKGNFEEVSDICKNVSAKIAEKYGTQYTVGTAFDTVGYLSSGVSGCWVKSTLNVPYVVTFELRDSGYHGFALPPKEILPTCQETIEGLKILLRPSRSQPPSNFSNRTYNISEAKCLLVFNLLIFIMRFY